jgi:hypothetical protein
MRVELARTQLRAGALAGQISCSSLRLCVARAEDARVETCGTAHVQYQARRSRRPNDAPCGASRCSSSTTLRYCLRPFASAPAARLLVASTKGRCTARCADRAARARLAMPLGLARIPEWPETHRPIGSCLWSLGDCSPHRRAGERRRHWRGACRMPPRRDGLLALEMQNSLQPEQVVTRRSQILLVKLADCKGRSEPVPCVGFTAPLGCARSAHLTVISPFMTIQWPGNEHRYG